MSADLKLEVAKSLAGALVTIGHPYGEAAINATALDLIKWCHGGFTEGRNWTPEKQAEWLVSEARETWEDGWPEKGGTPKLRKLFLSKFHPHALQPGNQVVDWANEPCVCGEGKKFRDCCQGKPLFTETIVLPARPDPKSTFNNFEPLTEERLQKALDDERRRKAEQLRKLGLD